ncbi:MAG: hypothetical protein GX786_09365, partial [Clostridiales bacterium]|nr:hypothetical protein [Clostridiales bacterium]
TVDGATIPLQNPPIVSNGEIYLPASELTKALSFTGVWVPALNSFQVGMPVDGIDFVDMLEPYEKSTYFRRYPSNKNEERSFAGLKTDHWIGLSGWSGEAYYNLDGKYTSLSFDAYTAKGFNKDFGLIEFYGDNDVLLTKIEVKQKELPTSWTVDLTNVYRLKMIISGDPKTTALYNMIVK